MLWAGLTSLGSTFKSTFHRPYQPIVTTTHNLTTNPPLHPEYPEEGNVCVVMVVGLVGNVVLLGGCVV